MISIMVPTMNRSEFIIRLLQYYADLQSSCWILIADSSDERHLRATREAISALQGRLRIRHVPCPGQSCAQSLIALGRSLETPYAVYLGDDDFLIPEGLQHCVEFLAHHPDYSSAHGLALSFALRSSGAYGEFAGVGGYHLRPLEQDRAAERLNQFLKHYFVNMFSVQRSENWKTVCRHMAAIPNRVFAEELLPCCLSVIHGKVKALESLYLARQVHDQRYVFSDAYDWLTGDEWQPSYKVFRDIVVQALTTQDNLDAAQAGQVFKEAFWSYLGRDLSPGGRPRRVSAWSRVKDHLKAQPMAVQAVAAIERRFYPSNHVSLPMLLTDRSAYHRQFMPFYKLITRAA